MPFTMFTLAMLLICILCLGREIFLGFVRGSLRALMSLCTVILSIICSFFVSRATGGIIATALVENVIKDLIVENVEIIAGFLSVYETASFLIQAIANVLVFVIAFPLFRWLFNGLVAITLKSALQKARNSKEADKLWGSVIGALCGTIIAITVISPIMGTVHLFGDVVHLVDNIGQSIPPQQNIAIPELDPIDDYTSDAVGDFCYTIGGQLIYKHLTMADFNGEKISLIDEVTTLREASESAVGIVASFSQEDDPDNFKENADKAYLCFEHSDLLRTIAIEFVTDFSSAWLQGEDFLGIYIPDFNNDFKPLVNEILVVCSDINEYNIMPTAKTLLDIVGVVVECDIKTDTSTDEVDYYLLASKFSAIFESNPGMESVKWQLENVANVAIADYVSQNLTLPQRASITTAIARDTAEVLVETEGTEVRITSLTEKLLQCFEEYELAIDASLCELFAYKLVRTAEANYDQISSSDVDALLNLTRGGIVN